MLQRPTQDLLNALTPADFDLSSLSLRLTDLLEFQSGVFLKYPGWVFESSISEL